MADAVDVVDHSLSIVGHVVLAAGETAFFAANPVFALPIIRQFIEWILWKFESQVVIQLQSTSNAVIIFVSEENNAKAATAASDKLKEVQSDKAATDAAKQKAADDFKAAYEKLIHFRTNDPTAMG